MADAETESDLFYVMGPTGRVRVNPVIAIGMVKYTSRSGRIAQANVAQVLFGQADESIITRTVVNIGEDATLWINFLGGDAAIGEPDSIPLKPGAGATINTWAPVSIISDTADAPFTAMEG